MAIEKMNDQYSTDTRLALLEQCVNNINNTLVRIEQRIEKSDSYFESRFDRFEDRFNQLQSEIRSYHRWTMSGFFSTYAMIAASITAFIVKVL